MEEHVTGSPVTEGEVDGQGTQTALAGQPKGRVFVEDRAIQMNADVGSHVGWTVVQHLMHQPRIQIRWAIKIIT